MLGHDTKNDGLLQKLGFHDYSYNPKNNINDDPVRFLKPTSSVPNLYAVGRKGESLNKS
jgi:hypothetical protein